MLALRSTPAQNTRWLRFCAWVIRIRLCSQWCHAGVVINGVLYQSNATRGLHATEDWNPENWTLIDLGPARDEQALALFDVHEDAPYDWLGVLGFALPVRGERRAMYCFEWCAVALGAPRARWQTPERLLTHIVTLGMRP